MSAKIEAAQIIARAGQLHVMYQVIVHRYIVGISIVVDGASAIIPHIAVVDIVVTDCCMGSV